jgi:hypothetical protein
MSCETRSYGQFVKRSLVFHPNGVSWEGEYDFYRDPDCKHGSLSVLVSGDYVKERKSRKIAGTSDYKFNITQMSIIPHPSIINCFSSRTFCNLGGLDSLDFFILRQSLQSLVCKKKNLIGNSITIVTDCYYMCKCYHLL